MKVQERTGAGNHRVPAPAHSAGERLPTPTRERKPALAALAVLLILVGALGATILVLRAGDRVEVAQLSSDIEAGAPVERGDVTSVLVAEDAAVNYIKMTQIDQVASTLRTKSALYKGTVLVGEMFTGAKGLPAGKASVGLSLKAGQYPAGIKNGDLVAAYRVKSSSGSTGTTGSAGTDSNDVIVDKATVSAVVNPEAGTISSGNLPVTLTVDSADVAALTQASSAGEVAIVIVPSSNS
ncbi:hypothetical protein [Streptomyces sp. NPDC088725]|uniref:hypothetical protein n=1 Tax=Streptomyces sp. NPDC088725 TaxID=3365873 RepID=UPI00380C60AF